MTTNSGLTHSVPHDGRTDDLDKRRISVTDSTMEDDGGMILPYSHHRPKLARIR